MTCFVCLGHVPVPGLQVQHARAPSGFQTLVERVESHSTACAICGTPYPLVTEVVGVTLVWTRAQRFVGLMFLVGYTFAAVLFVLGLRNFQTSTSVASACLLLAGWTAVVVQVLHMYFTGRVCCCATTRVQRVRVAEGMGGV